MLDFADSFSAASVAAVSFCSSLALLWAATCRVGAGAAARYAPADAETLAILDMLFLSKDVGVVPSRIGRISNRLSDNRSSLTRVTINLRNADHRKAPATAHQYSDPRSRGRNVFVSTAKLHANAAVHAVLSC